MSYNVANGVTKLPLENTRCLQQCLLLYPACDKQMYYIYALIFSHEINFLFFFH